jgi:hypothetical protein
MRGQVFHHLRLSAAARAAHALAVHASMLACQVPRQPETGQSQLVLIGEPRTLQHLSFYKHV